MGLAFVAWFPTFSDLHCLFLFLRFLRQSFYIAQVGLELVNLFSHPPHSWGSQVCTTTPGHFLFFNPSLLYSLQSHLSLCGHIGLALLVQCLPMDVWLDCQVQWGRVFGTHTCFIPLSAIPGSPSCSLSAAL